MGRPLWTLDGDALVATVSETTLGRGQLQSFDYPSGEMHRFSNDLADYSSALDMTRDGRQLAVIQRNRISDVWTAPQRTLRKHASSRQANRSITRSSPVPRERFWPPLLTAICGR